MSSERHAAMRIPVYDNARAMTVVAARYDLRACKSLSARRGGLVEGEGFSAPQVCALAGVNIEMA